MKRVISVITTVMIICCSLVFYVSAEKVKYEQPFDSGTCGSQTFRIPSIITLNNGSVMAAADMRYNHGTDAPNNIDTLVAVSENGRTDWQYDTVNYFDDCADATTDTSSASFIDSALVQSKETDRIFIITDAFPSGMGYNQAKRGNGYITDSEGVSRLALTSSDSAKIKDYKFYVGDFDGEFATVHASNKNYSVDREFNLYLDGKPLYTKQINSDKQVQQNIFFSSSELHVFPTSYLWMRYSDDNGKTWSAPSILNSQIKNKNECFLGIGPGRGCVIRHNDGERIIFTVYDNYGITENTSTIYSDDNGLTWSRGERADYRIGLWKTSEAQLITLPDGMLHIFARNSSSFLATGTSADGGETWTRLKAEKNLNGNANCMSSFINVHSEHNDKNIILGSYASDCSQRADGVIMVGTVSDDCKIDWTYSYHINSGFFAYSCLTELSDGTIGILYEDEAAHIQYKILELTNCGTLSEINGDNIDYENTDKGSDNFINKLKYWLIGIGFYFKLL